MLKWKFKLEAFDITYRPRTSIRGQVLADFIAKKADEGGPLTEVQIKETVPEPWVVFTNGSSCLEGSGAKLILTNLEGKEFTYALRFELYALNNKAEYEALIAGMWIAEQMGVKNLITKVDSRLIANQINGLMYSGLRSVVAKEIKSGYYWPAMHKDARNIIRVYSDCQTHRPVPRNPQEKLTSITSPWTFYKSGIDISGPFPEGQGKDNIVCGFEPPGEIISDNEKQFRDNPFKDWCEKLNIKRRFASIKYPQTNGQVKRENCSLGEGINARLCKDNRKWVKEVPHVLWTHRTMIKTSNGDTSFSLTYVTEAVIPVKIRIPSIRCAEVNQAENDEGLLLNLDILKKRREKAAVCEAKSKAKMEK
nr:reverse transcriptase domain-containing protein [Tanacetum cinerariifolium]